MKHVISSILGIGFLLLSTHGMTERHDPHHEECCTIRGSGVVNKIFIPPAVPVETKTRFTRDLDTDAETEEEQPALTLFQVNYDSNVPLEAQTAINYALLLWQDLIHSDVTIQVHVEWVMGLSDEQALASAGATSYPGVTGDSILPDHYEPIAIAERKWKYNLNPGSNDIAAII